MSDVITIETATMERREAMDTRPQDQYAGRLKFACCRECGSPDGMQGTHRETLKTLLRPELERLVPILHGMSGDSTSLFYACYYCNRDRVIPTGFEPMSLTEVLNWRDANPIQQEIQDNE